MSFFFTHQTGGEPAADVVGSTGYGLVRQILPPIRTAAASSATAANIKLLEQSMSCVFADSRIRVTGCLARSVGGGANNNDGQRISLYVDGVEVSFMTDWSATNGVTNTPFCLFYDGPGDKDPHLYQLYADATNSTIYTKSANWMMVEEIASA